MNELGEGRSTALEVLAEPIQIELMAYPVGEPSEEDLSHAAAGTRVEMAHEHAAPTEPLFSFHPDPNRESGCRAPDLVLTGPPSSPAGKGHWQPISHSLWRRVPAWG